MAADVVLDPQPANPCCAELKKRYLKLEEKRNALRQAVKLLEGQANKLQDENAALKELCEKECKRADLAQQAKGKESDIKSILKKEIQDLKSEIASLQENGNLRDQDRNQLLETRILQGEAEIKGLKEQLQKEIKRAESEKKKVMEEKKKTAEAWELVKIEKCRAEEEKRIADIERKKTEDMRHSLAKVKSEASEARDHVSEERKKAELANKKVELERQKVCREKKRADLERARFEEQRELVEIERKKTVDEKDRADHLLQQLEEERQMRAELQKEMEKILSHRQGPKSCLGSYKTEQGSGSKEDTQSANIKLLKNKLKLGRNELKHAKRMIKLEKAEKRLLLQQLYLLKQDHLQFSRRLEMLIDCSSYCMEGTDGLEKVDGSLMRCAKPCATRPQRKCVCAEHGFNSQIETKTNCMDMEYMGPITSCTWHLHQKCGGRSTRPISGISSDLESPVGDSVRDKPQNSAVCSTAVTYSDTQLMGSQGRSAFAVPTSAKMVMDNQGLPSSNFTGETKNLHVVQQGNDGICHSKMEFPCMKHIVGNGIQVAKNDSQCNRGKRKAQVIVDAADCSCCLKISNDNSVFEDINSKSFVPPVCRSDDISSLNGGKNLTTELSDDSDTRNCQFHMKEKSSKRQKLGLQPSDNIDNHKEVYGYEMDGHNETCINEATLPFPGAGEHALTCRNKSDDVFMDDQAALIRLETIISEDYMKLLDLDDDAEEERYQAARERPLSPTLPELEPPSRSSLGKCCASDGKCDSMKEKLVAVVEPHRLNRLSASSSQEQLDCHLIPEKINPCNTSEDINGALLLMSNSECIQLPLDGCAHVASSSDTCASLTDVDRESRSNMKKETAKQMSLSEDKELECANRANGQHWRIDGCCVIFSNTKDEEVISRVLCTRNAIIHDISQGDDTGFSVATVLHALAANLNLSAEEKACILFSLLLCKVSAMIPVDPATHTGDLSLESELVIAEMDRVFSDDDTRPTFFTTCLLDIFVSLIQDFLTARKVMVCGEREQSDLCSSDTVCHLDNESRTWTMKTAAVTQLVAGSVILASICTVYDRVDILWQTSFQLLRMCRNDPYWILTAVHVFASICGVKFFSPTHHNLIVTAIKSLILLLERGEEFGSITSIGDKCPRFCVCVDCPFAEGQVCVDKVMSHLLEELQICLASAARNHDSKKLVIFSYSTCHPCNGHDAKNNQFDVSSKECDAFCSPHDDVHDQNTEAGFCHLTDIISLVELFGYHTGWECVHSKIIPQLFTLLESCSSSAFSVSFLVLIGQLGRIGVETGDCDQRDVEGLMCSLSMFMDVDRTGKSGLPVQFAAVDALLNLLPLDFGEIVEGPLNVLLAPSQVTHAEHIRRWFQQLGEEQKAVSLRLFQDSNLKKG